jgi:hypothetical protein
MLDFPASPSVGQKYPASPLAGIPTYTWDGEKWTTQGGSIVSASPGTLLPLMDAKPALVGVSTNFSREDHVHPVDTSRAPFDAMAYSGLQINGGMEVSQERGFGSLSNSIGYVCDGWRSGYSGTVIVASAAYLAAGFAGFPNFLGLAPTTAQASLGAGDYAITTQGIEGYRIARLSWGTVNAQPITIGFWTSHHRPGLYSGSVRNSVSGVPNRSYVFTYTQTAADTPQYNTVTIPGDTAGTWATDNTIGMLITFSMGSGSTWTAPSANTWTAGSYQAAPGQTNAVAATTDVFRLTGVIVLPGSEAPSAARSPFVMRPFDQELVTCQRYWQKSYDYAFPPGTIGNANGAIVSVTVTAGALYNYVGNPRFRQRMRVVPTITLFNPSSGGTALPIRLGNAGTDAPATILYPGSDGFAVHVANSSVPQYEYVTTHYTADARL